MNTLENITVASDNEKLAEALSKSYEEISLLHKIGDLTVNIRDLPRQIRSICKQLRKVIECDYVAIIWNDLRNNDSTKTDKQNQPEVFQEGKYLLAGNSISAIWQEAKHIAKNDKASFIIENSPTKASSRLIQNINNYIIAPIVTNHGTVGAIAACGKYHGDNFCSIESRLVLSVANKLSNCHENQTLYTDQQELLMGTLRALIRTIDAKDPYTCGHSERVARISRYIAEKLKLDDQQIESAYMAGLLHDIGKIGIKGSTLRKDARLTLEEFEEVKQHPLIGADILKGIRQISEVVHGVRTHHERYDGKGYPAGISGKSIPVIGRIVKIADTFDAMMSTRTYRKSLPVRKVLSEIARFSGTQFDPEISDILLNCNIEELKNIISYTENEYLSDVCQYSPRYILPETDDLLDDSNLTCTAERYTGYDGCDDCYAFKSEYYFLA